MCVCSVLMPGQGWGELFVCVPVDCFTMHAPQSAANVRWQIVEVVGYRRMLSKQTSREGQSRSPMRTYAEHSRGVWEETEIAPR